MVGILSLCICFVCAPVWLTGIISACSPCLCFFPANSIGFLGCGYTVRDMISDCVTWFQLPLTLINLK